MPDQLIKTNMVQLHYPNPPILDEHALLNELKTRLGNVEKAEQEDVYLFTFPDHIVHFQDADAPAALVLMYGDDSKGQPAFHKALEQTRLWPDAAKVVAENPTTLILTEMTAAGLEYKTRLHLFHNLLQAVLAQAPCKAIDWVPSQQIVNPAAYTDSCQREDFHPLNFCINVRFYQITNGESGAMLMDTIGLGTLGLRDLQCHFVKLDPNDVARVLYDLAYYIFDHGDIIDDGNTIHGIKPTDKWRCQNEKSMVGPERQVIDINPGESYAAGKRR
jgi:hypothetical protein